MSMAIRVQGLHKSFFPAQPAVQRLARWLGVSRKTRANSVLRDISFEVPLGQALGIVGINGAGKSTLLKLLVGTLRPNAGHIEVNGRVSAILELGMGLNDALTGRANARFSLSMQGWNAEQIDSLIAQLQSFAELGDYFDQPLRIYSSGMRMRLAFAIATCVRPDVLIIDEALSVGDAYFHHKCAQHIRDMREQGMTLLLVSHDVAAVRAMCDSVILLESGRISAQGNPQEILELYNAKLSNPTAETTQHSNGGSHYGDGKAEILSWRLLPVAGATQSEQFVVGQTAQLELECRIGPADLEQLVVGMQIKDRLGHIVFGTNTAHLDCVTLDARAGEHLRFFMSFPMNLVPGSYSLTLALSHGETHIEGNYHWIDRACVFEVERGDNPYSIGTAYLRVSTATQRLEMTA